MGIKRFSSSSRSLSNSMSTVIMDPPSPNRDLLSPHRDLSRRLIIVSAIEGALAGALIEPDVLLLFLPLEEGGEIGGLMAICERGDEVPDFILPSLLDPLSGK